MKKLVVLILMAALFVGVLPYTAFAAPGSTPPLMGQQPRQQGQVSDPGITVSGGTGNSYSFILTWLRPFSQTIDALHGAQSGTNGTAQQELDLGRPSIPGPDPMPGWDSNPGNDDVWTLHPTSYEIDFRNATAPGSVWNETVDQHVVTTGISQAADAAGGRVVSPVNLTRTMQPNSLYEIRITPIKYNPRFINIPMLPPATGHFRAVEWARAPVDTALPPQRNIVLMTDIEIAYADGRGNTLVIEWDNPTFNGANIFDQWEIAFASNLPPTVNIGNQNLRVVPFSNIEQLPGGRLRYTVTGAGIAPLQNLSVRVEPLINGQRVRPVLQGVTIPGTNQVVNIAGRPDGEFRRDDILVVPELHLEQVGENRLRLHWPSLAGLTINRVEIEEWRPDITQDEVTEDNAQPPDRLGVIGYIQHSPLPANVSEWLVDIGQNRGSRAFVLAIWMDADGPPVRTNIVFFDPRVVDFSPYRPEIIQVIGRATAPGTGVLDNFRFLAFARPPFSPDEIDLIEPDFSTPTNPRIVDRDMIYEIFVAETQEALMAFMASGDYLFTWAPGGAEPVRQRMRDEPPQYDPAWELPTQITHFMRPGVAEPLLIRDNMVYFIGVRAVRYPGGQRSQNSYVPEFVPPYGDIAADPEMIASPPVRAVLDEVTQTEIPIEWPLRYLEIMRPVRNAELQRYNWFAVLGVDRSGNLIYGRSASHIENVVGDAATTPGGAPRYAVLNDMLPAGPRNQLQSGAVNAQNPTAVRNFLTEHARPAIEEFVQSRDGSFSSPAALRIQDVSRRNFEIHVVEYNHMMNAGGGFEAYMASINNNNNNAAAWNSITPTVTNGVAREVITDVDVPSGTVEGNTTYVIFIRPYQIFANVRRTARYPSYVIVTTPSDVERPAPGPTVPILHPVYDLVTDRTIGVRWRVQADMGFELMMGESLQEFIARAGNPVPPPLNNQAAIDAALANPDILFEIRNVGGVPYYFLRIDNLFPDTMYYVWARAIGLDDEGAVYAGRQPSEWSNPVNMRTLGITPPPPPNIAPAAQTQLNIYNRINNTEYVTTDPNALHVILTRIVRDTAPREGDGTATGGSARHMELPVVTHARMFMVRFDELQVNRRHYVRARTILTVTREGDGVRRQYAYEIQVADNEDFLDPITFTIPTVNDLPQGGLRAYSDWVSINLVTGRSGDEYDGAFHPDQFPLPEQDWEISYDANTQTLTWRFRTNQIGADGRPDQQVDQRFITRLVQQRVFTYTIDMSDFEGMPITNRVVELPLSISRAFDERLITLEITTDEKAVQIPPGAFNTAATRDLQMGIGSNYRITISAVEDQLPTLSPNTRYATVPQELRVQAITPNRTVRMDTFARPVEVILPMDNFDTPDVGMNTGLFFNGAAGGWESISGALTLANTVRGGIQQPGTFAAISRQTPPVASPEAESHPSTIAMQRVTSRMTITDMNQFNPNQEVTADAFNNIVLALSNGRTSVTIGQAISNNDAQSLRRARMYAPQNLTREVAMDIMVRQYELRTRQVLRPMATAGAVPGLSSASPELQQNLLKAADLGFINGPFQPEGALTMGELMNMVDIIMMDAGM